MAIKNKTKDVKAATVSHQDKLLIKEWLKHKAKLEAKGIRVTFKPARFITSIEQECGTIYLEGATTPPTQEEINQRRGKITNDYQSP